MYLIFFSLEGVFADVAESHGLVIVGEEVVSVVECSVGLGRVIDALGVVVGVVVVEPPGKGTESVLYLYNARFFFTLKPLKRYLKF